MTSLATNDGPAESRKTDRLVQKRFEFLNCLGKGAFASIFKAKDKLYGRTVAVKEIKKSGSIISQPLSEYLLGKMLNHEHIVKTLDCVDTRSSLYIVLELANGGDLFTLLDPTGPGIAEDLARKIASQLACGVSYLHSKNIVHSDIKPENVLIDNGIVKICDYGLAAYHATTRPGPALGTGAYMAPEIVCVRSKEEIYSVQKEQDVWSIGIVMYAILFADLPWEKARKTDTDYKTFLGEGGVTSRLYPFSMLSKPMLGMMAKMLCSDPEKRCKIEDVAEFLSNRHPWFATQERLLSKPASKEETAAPEAVKEPDSVVPDDRDDGALSETSSLKSASTESLLALV